MNGARLPTAISSVVNRLLIADLRAHLPGRALDQLPPLTEIELSRAMGAASLLAFSDQVEERMLAYEIATRAIDLTASPSPGLLRAAELVLARLGNFPGRDLLRRRHKGNFGDGKGATLIRWEATLRRLENTITDAAGQPFTVTDFQFEVLQTFAASRSVSLSAPTSAGKSFILALHLIRRLKARAGQCIVYVVPTRALIRQVIVTLRVELQKAGMDELPVRCIPTPIAMDKAPQGIIYVLTQERLISLLHSDADAGQVWINTLVVDEAQGIGENGRGVILHSAIDEVVHGFPQVEVIFACPLARNPRYLLGLFGREAQGTPFLERQSPVSQNLILVDFPQEKEAAFRLLRDRTTVLLGRRKLDFDPLGQGVLERRARFAHAIAVRDGCCLLYADGAKDAEKLAFHLARVSTAAPTEDQEIQEFIDYLREHIHPEYGLIPVLRKRIAFHYGNMPGNVRAGVEELCKHGKLRFICCTSTLLQGINLPARDIVIENPKRGKGTPMLRADFLNLSGRAGRLTREFHGNVWCLRPDAWDRASFKGEPLQTIQSAFEETVRDGGMSVRKVLENPDLGEDEQSAVATISRVYTDFVAHRATLDASALCSPENRTKWLETVRMVESMETNLPALVYSRNYSILPSRLEGLYQHMIQQVDPTELMLLHPGRPGSAGRLYSALQVTDQFIEGKVNQSFRHFYHLVKQWVWGWPLGRIIENQISYHENTGGATNRRNLIYEIIHDLEHDIRYRYAKNFRAYNDVLGIVLRDQGYPDEAERLVPYHLFMESGGSDPVYLALVSLGLSRTSALMLRRRIKFRSTVTPEECLRALKRIDPRFFKLPPFCLREVSLITGRNFG